jgi:hypothetical protein
LTQVGPSGQLPGGALAPLLSAQPLELRPTLERFIAASFQVNALA